MNLENMLVLRDTLLSDLNKIIQMEDDTETNQFITPYNLERHKQVIENKNEIHLSIFDKKEKLIGFVILAGLTNGNDSIEFRRIVISEKGKGFGAATIEKIKKKCFEEYACHRLWLDLFDFNERAKHIYKKLGFSQEGVLRECIKTDEGYINLIVMSILKREYEKENGSL